MKNIFTVCLIVLGFAASAQEFELGKVTKAELEEKAHPKEPDAPAAILFDEGNTYMEFNEQQGFMLVTETSTRIKIYKKEGYDWANHSIRYYVGTNPTEKVQITKAATYNLVNGQIEKTKLKSDGEFDERIDKNYMRKKIAMPNVREGSVIEYKCRVSTPFLNDVPTWAFQSGIPVNYSHYTTRFPEYYLYKDNIKGFISPVRTQSSDSKSLTLTSKDRQGGTGHSPVSTSFSSDNITYREAVTDYVCRDMPSMKAERYVNNIRNYLASVENELSLIKWPNKPEKYLSTTWEDVVKTIYDTQGFGDELKKNGYFEDDLPAITAGMADEDSKINAIFNSVKSRMKWNEYTDYICDAGVRKAYKDKVGNSAEINLMLTAMLRAAGLKADPVLVSTRANGISFFPSRKAYNYVISAVDAGGKTILLDATSPYALPGILPVRDLNWMGYRIRPDGKSDMVDLMPTTNSKDALTLMASLDDTGKIQGKIREQYYDYNAFLYRENYAQLKKDSYLGQLEKQHPGLEVGEYGVTADDVAKPVTENYDFTDAASVENINGKLYFSPLLCYAEKENPFKQETRAYPVDFVFPHEDRYTISITLPQGYAVETLPAPISVSMPENIGKFMYNISASGSQIQVSAIMDINTPIVSSEAYEALKNFYKMMLDKENEKVVLRKI